MTGVKAPAAYESGWCATGQHDRCRGAYAGTECHCPHHAVPPLPVDDPEPAAEVLPLLLARHCPSCTCAGHGPA